MLATSTRTKFTIDYSFNCNAKFLYFYLFNPEGLAEWFAQKVVADSNGLYTFTWEQDTMKAQLLEKRFNKYVKYKWEDTPKDEFFEMRIIEEPITGDVMLEIQDFAETNNPESAIKIWDTSIIQLKTITGS